MNEDLALQSGLPLVDTVVHSMRPASATLRGDMRSSGMVGLLKSLRSYDPSKGGFEVYARRRIRGEILDDLRSADWLPRSARAKANPPTLVSLTVASDVQSHDVSPIDAAVSNDVLGSLETLPDRLRQIMIRHYWFGESFTEIGKLFHLTGVRIGQLHSQAIRALRRMEECEVEMLSKASCSAFQVTQ